MDALPRYRLTVAAALAVAVVAGWQIAQERLLLAGLLGGVLLLWLLSRLAGVAIDALVVGGVLFGYLVGNRGFAQLHTPGLPLLPGELALGVGMVVLAWQTARTKALPVRRDALNFLLLCWLALGAARLRLDFPAHGFVAVRDFATLYYALFFFLAQAMSADPGRRRWLERCLTAGFALVAPVFLAFTRWPDFFSAHLAVFGVPLIYVKSDVAGGFMVAGVFWFLATPTLANRRWAFALASLNLVGVALSNSRAALVALAVACGWLAVCRDWRRLRPIGAMAATGLMVLLLATAASDRPFTQSLIYRLYASATSTMDFNASTNYESAGLGDKLDNNQFRLIWWQAVVDETLDRGPWLGLGFGYDLADQFLRIYYGEGGEDFSARSPHNFLLTVFARMGAVGLAFLLVPLGVIAMRTWRAGRRSAAHTDGDPSLGLWLGAWGILVSACFGVVLEGPMGAMVFWTVLGLANASSTGFPAGSDAATAAPAKIDADLRSAATVDEVAARP